MTRWSKSECQTFYENAREAVTEQCEVLIIGGVITVDARHFGGNWIYKGHEVGTGHFSLGSETHHGTGTLHHDDAEDVLEGWWDEEGLRGMWRITLGQADEMSNLERQPEVSAAHSPDDLRDG